MKKTFLVLFLIAMIIATAVCVVINEGAAQEVGIFVSVMLFSLGVTTVVLRVDPDSIGKNIFAGFLTGFITALILWIGYKDRFFALDDMVYILTFFGAIVGGLLNYFTDPIVRHKKTKHSQHSHHEHDPHAGRH